VLVGLAGPADRHGVVVCHVMFTKAERPKTVGLMSAATFLPSPSVHPGRLAAHQLLVGWVFLLNVP